MKTSTFAAARQIRYATLSTALLAAAQTAAEEAVNYYTTEWKKLGRKVDADDIEYAASVRCPVATRLVTATAELEAINVALFGRN